MFKPNKYTDISRSVLGVSAELLSQLTVDPVQKYYQVESKVCGTLGESVKDNLFLALIFLYAIGKIKYYEKEDVIELVKVSQ